MLRLTPDQRLSAREIFGIDADMQVPAFSHADEHVPEIDRGYRFNRDVTLAILAGFAHNRRVLVHGWHGSGKSTHIEQVAARLNWPCARVNLDGHISRLDLVGRDVIAIRDGLQVTEFQEGVVPWALQRPMALILDEFDAGRPDVMFVMHRILERDGKFTLLDQNRVLAPHPAFRLFATANTVGLGNLDGLYHGAQTLNQGQMDRWSMVAHLDYPPPEDEIDIVLAQVGQQAGDFQLPEQSPTPPPNRACIAQMVAVAGLTRRGFAAGDLRTVMSPRTVIAWAENYGIFGDLERAFRLSFVDRCDPAERSIIAEYYQRVFGEELTADSINVLPSDAVSAGD